ncbi:MAG: transketolase C-terminal domain-containing protein, partial [Dehalococcoidia bacterium]|nr:transketolase C-terminal domain-containing protein [Dehalococcoidia bacterium]
KDVCYHNANVKIVDGGGGLTYGALGATHHVTEDLAIMRSLPNMTVVAPGDPVEAALATKAVARSHGPCYLRLGKTGDPVVHQTAPYFQLGKAIRLREGNDVTLVTTGGMLCNTMQAAEQLGRQGIQSRVLSMHTIKPLDSEAVLAATMETGSIVTIEEHSVIGGLGSAVAEVISQAGSPHSNLMILGIPDAFCSQVGSQKSLLELYSLSVEGIVSSVKQFVKGRQKKPTQR